MADTSLNPKLKQMVKNGKKKKKNAVKQKYVVLSESEDEETGEDDHAKGPVDEIDQTIE